MLDQKGSLVELIWHILSVIASLSIPAFGWVGRAYSKMQTRLIKTETILELRSKELDDVKREQGAHAHRLTNAESNILQLQDIFREMKTEANERHKEITAKLDYQAAYLPAIDATLKSVQRVCDTMVPRTEVEQRFDALAERIDSQEDRIRDIHRK